MVSTVTSTLSVRGSKSTVSPSATSVPLTWNVESDVSSFAATVSVTSYSSEVTPSAAVTVTARLLSPTVRSVSPAIS